MSAQVVGFPGQMGPLQERRAQIARRGVQLDFDLWLGKLERTCRWLDRHNIEIYTAIVSTISGGKVGARFSTKLHELLKEDLWSAGFHSVGGVRFEQMRARDPATGVLICWEEEASA